MWLEFDGNHTVVVDVPKYIASQRVEYCQISDVMDKIRARDVPIFAYIDISELNVRDVDLIGLIDIVWDLADRFDGERFLKRITFIGASRAALSVWRTAGQLLPSIISELIIFE